jgi:hypothetical protein
MSVRSPHSLSGFQRSKRIVRSLDQRNRQDLVMIGVLSIALFFGLIGFAAHVLWLVAIIVMALGLGYVLAGGQRDSRPV